MEIFIVIGIIENVYEEIIGGPSFKHSNRHVVKVFRSKENAKKFIEKSKLKKPKKEPFGDTSYYKGGYCDLEIESHYIEI